MLTIAHIEKALALTDFDSASAQLGMSPAGRASMTPKLNKPPRQSAVLVLIYPDTDQKLQVILTKRTEQLRGHSGQISFPGGRRDEGDKSYEETALREACEEVGVCNRSRIRILGQLAQLWIPPSNFEVMPIVATMDNIPQLVPSPAEVAQILFLPLDNLLKDDIKKTTPMTFRGTVFDVPYYDVQGHIVWGATAAMLSELEHRLRTTLTI
ncbi:MAG: CoA pyrophosphatase [Chloroflexota bacterium]